MRREIKARDVGRISSHCEPGEFQIYLLPAQYDFRPVREGLGHKSLSLKELHCSR